MVSFQDSFKGAASKLLSELCPTLKNEQNSRLEKLKEIQTEATVAMIAGGILFVLAVAVIASRGGVVSTCFGGAAAGVGGAIFLDNFNRRVIAVNAEDIVREPLKYVNFNLASIFSSNHTISIDQRKIFEQLAKNTLFGRPQIESEKRAMVKMFGI
jgi:hypothetical protein